MTKLTYITSTAALTIILSCDVFEGPQGPRGRTGATGLPGEVGSEGPRGDTGPQGNQGVQGVAGVDGVSIDLTSVSIVLDRALLPWEDNNKVTINGDSLVVLPRKFTVPQITGSLNGGGWIDIRVGSSVFCYQRTHNTKDFNYSYLKLTAATSGCDTNSDKDDTTIVSDPIIAGSFSSSFNLQVIPREPKLAGITPTLTFFMFTEK